MPDHTAPDDTGAGGDRDRQTPSLGGELVIPVAAVAFVIYYFITIRESSWTAQVGAFFIGTILIVLCLGFIASVLLRIRRGTNLYTITLVSLGITLGGYLLFIVAFKSRFPHGPFEALMDRLF